MTSNGALCDSAHRLFSLEISSISALVESRRRKNVGRFLSAPPDALCRSLSEYKPLLKFTLIFEMTKND
nr:MAG TPA: hypothetical protein [Caudoviricetes sp.]